MAKAKSARCRPKPKSAETAKLGVALALELVGGSNFSAFVNEAVRLRSQQVQMLRLLDDLDAEFGPVGKSALVDAGDLWHPHIAHPIT
jgi:hypothetical protein